MGLIRFNIRVLICLVCIASLPFILFFSTEDEVFDFGPCEAIFMTQFYDANNTARNDEYEKVARANLANPYIKEIIWIVQPELVTLPDWLRGTSVVNSGPPTFRYAVEIMQKFDRKGLKIFANSDIYIPPESVKTMCQRTTNKNLLALSRWDLGTWGNLSSAHFTNASWTQDVWAWRGNLKTNRDWLFPMGQMRSDNRIAYLMSKQRHVINPSCAIPTYHFHQSYFRTYNRSNPIPGEVLFVEPTC